MATSASPIKMFTSWSFSRWSDYMKCPLFAKLKHLDKIQEPHNPAMDRGSDIHSKAEYYVVGAINKLPPELVKFKDEFAKLRKMYKSKKLPVLVEQEWAFTSTWTVTEWKNWVKAWVRIKIDSAHFEEPSLMIVTDYKTGKFDPYRNEEYMLQLELYAVGAFLSHPQDKDLRVRPRILYTDTGESYPPLGEEVEFTRTHLPRLLKGWEKRTAPMLRDKRFAPRPSKKCSWCFYSRKNNGNCKF